MTPVREEEQSKWLEVCLKQINLLKFCLKQINLLKSKKFLRKPLHRAYPALPGMHSSVLTGTASGGHVAGQLRKAVGLAGRSVRDR